MRFECADASESNRVDLGATVGADTAEGVEERMIASVVALEQLDGIEAELAARDVDAG